MLSLSATKPVVSSPGPTLGNISLLAVEEMLGVIFHSIAHCTKLPSIYTYYILFTSYYNNVIYII